MFRIVNRLIQWTGKYKRRIYIGFIYAFIHSIFTAIPIMLAAKGLSAVLDDWGGVKPLEGRDIWIMLGAMILAVLGRYLFSYLRAITQESVGYEATADERIRLGDILKRVSLGFFSKNNMGELSAAATTDLSFMEMFAMNMVNTVVNGYITVIVLILFLAFYSPLAGGIALAGVLLSALFLHLLEARSHQNAPIHQKAQDDMVESSIEYLRGMQVVKAFKQEGVSIAGIRKAYNDSKKINIKIEVEYMPFNCLHLFSLKAASIAIVAVAAWLTYNGSMELPTMLMLDMFSFMIFGSVEAMNNAAHLGLCLERKEVFEETARKSYAIIEAFDLEKLHPGIILPLYFTLAQGYMKLGNPEKALELLERYTQLATSNIYPLSLHGDEYFDLLDGWLENSLTMGSDMPRNEMTIKKSAVEAIINCKTFEPLKDDVHFQNIIKRLKTLEENG